MPVTDVPKTDTQLFEFLRSRFGWGTYVEGGPDNYRTYQMRETGKIKRIRHARHISIEDVVMVADYCRAHRMNPNGMAAMMRHYKDARSWQSQQRRAEAEAEAQREIDDAIAYELTLEDSPWPEILIRAAGSERVAVIERWKQARHR